MERYCSGSGPSSANADLKPEVHSLIHQLVLDIHANEPDIEKSILIFLPTYYALEQQWILLKPLCTLFKIHILHRSIDTDQALLAMKICKSHRKVSQMFDFYATYFLKKTKMIYNGIIWYHKWVSFWHEKYRNFILFAFVGVLFCYFLKCCLWSIWLNLLPV